MIIASTSASTSVHQLELHGRAVAVRQEGRAGPVVLLVHGLAGTMRTWSPVVADLATRCSVVVPDLPGHGRSAPAPGDHSVGAYASWLRDLLDTLGHRGATVVGHSLGGGIAMQFAYQYPERCERLVLVSSGGLGPEVTAALRLAALPGAGQLLAMLTHRSLVRAGATLGRLGAAAGITVNASMLEAARAYATLADPESRRAFVHTLRAVIDHRGQRFGATDRFAAIDDIPNLLIWGTGDRIIPVEHAHDTHERLPTSRLVVFKGAGHFPHVADPDRFVHAVHSFVDDTAPGRRARRRRRPATPRAGSVARSRRVEATS